MKFDFEFEIKHVGFSADFYDVEPDDLPELTKRLYEQNRDTARIFVQNRDGVAFSAAEMLSWFLEKSGTSLQDHVPKEEVMESFNKGAREFSVSFPIDFTCGSFHMQTDGGPVDLSRLELAVQFFLHPKTH